MPTVEKTAGGRVNVRGIGEFVPGETYDVDDGAAAYLVEERGDFAYVDVTGSGSAGDENSEAESEANPESVADADVELCGAEMSNGSVCDRPADECPYHGDGSEA